MLEDVFHYLEDHQLKARHFTVEDPPNKTTLQKSILDPPTLVSHLNSVQRESKDRHTPRLITLSASDEAGVQRQAKAYARYFSQAQNVNHHDNYLDDLAYTLDLRRSKLAWKSYAVINSVEDLATIDNTISIPTKSTINPGLGFLFTGQGAQWAGMGRELMAFPVFEQSLRRSQETLSALGCSWKLLEEIIEQPGDRINTPQVAQPATTALQIALVDLLGSFEVYPTVVVGHSSGEIGAAYSAGALSADSALKVAYYRGTLSDLLAADTPGQSGGMMSVGLEERDAKSYVEDVTAQFGSEGLTVACINSPKNVTISGDVDQLNALKAILDSKKIFARKLIVSVAYHSKYMVKVAHEYGQMIQNLKPGIMPPKPVFMVSSVTGQRVDAAELCNAQYWVTNMLQPVRFCDAVSTVLKTSSQRIRKKLDLSHRQFFNIEALVEIGPHSALQGPVNDILLQERAQVQYCSVLDRKTGADVSALSALGYLKCLGYDVNMSNINGLGSNPQDLYTSLPDLPEYIFDRSLSYWEEPRISAQYRLGDRKKLDLLGRPIMDWNRLEATWRNDLRASEMPWIEDHVINGALIYPGAGMLVMAIEAANQLVKEDSGVVGFEATDVAFKRPLHIPQNSVGAETRLVIQVRQDSSQPLRYKSKFRLFTYDQGDWQECCNGYIRARYEEKENEVDNGKETREELASFVKKSDELQKACSKPVNVTQFYIGLNDSGLGLGPAFHRVSHVAFDDSDDIMEIHATIDPFHWPEQEYPEDHIIHPTTLDAILHVGFAAPSQGGEKRTPTMIPTFIRSLFVRKKGLSYPQATSIEASVSLQLDNQGADVSGFVLNTCRDALVAEVQDMRLTAVAKSDEDSEDDNLTSQPKAFHIEQFADPDLTSSEALVALCERARAQERTPFEHYMSLLAHKNGALRILDIETVDIQRTERILKVLSLLDDNTGKAAKGRFESFHISAATDQALAIYRAALRDYNAVHFNVFDTTQSLEDVAEDQYDIVFAPESAVAESATLAAITKFLSPQGKLVTFVNAQLEHDCNGNGLSSTNGNGYSHKSLAQTAFQSLNLELSTTLNSDSNGFVAHVYEKAGNSSVARISSSQVFLIIDTASMEQVNLTELLTKFWNTQGITHVTSGTMQDALSLESKKSTVFVVLNELFEKFMYNLSEAEYGLLKPFFQSASHVLWITAGGGSESSQPEYAVIHGMTRVLRNEYPGLNVTIAAFDARALLSEKQIAMLTQLLVKKHLQPDPSIFDVEFLEINNVFHIPRVAQSTTVTQELLKRSRNRNSSLVSFSDAPPLALTIDSVGMLETLHFEEDVAYSEPLAEDDVEIQTRAIGMNFKDYLIAMGQVTNAVVGQECAGIVTRVGSNASVKPGDRVILIALGAFKTYARGKVAIPMPENLSFTEAAAIPAQFGTAWEVLHRLARLQKGESILVHTAASGTGQALIQMAKAIGAIVYATVGSSDKQKFLVDHYGIPEENIFYSRDTSFAKGVMRVTKGRGVDVLVNTLIGELFQASLNCMAPYGRFVEIGLKSITSNDSLPLYGFRNNISFITFEGSIWLKERLDVARVDLEKIVGEFAQGKLHTALPLITRDIFEIEETFKTVQRGDTIGKYVFEITRESKVQATINTRPTSQLNPDATFVIAGGLGGIGRATARWMADRGAKNLVLLSRFGPRTDAGKDLVNELRLRNVRVETPACDVTDLETMRSVFGSLMGQMPPIKGVLQMSIIARDSLFDDLEYENWKVAVECKSIGSWNLHSVLPSGMDFFITLASGSGLAGVRGQANYDAGNTYEDALCRYRVSLGEKATSLDLGAMIDDGILAEDQELLNRVLGYGSLEPITRRMFNAILDYYTNPDLPVLSAKESQLAIGISMGTVDSLETMDLSRQPMLQPIMLAAQNVSASGGAGDAVNYREQFSSSASLDDAADLIADAVATKLSKSLPTIEHAASVDRDRPLQNYGVDSLVAIELRNWILKQFDADVAVFETQGSSTLGTLSIVVAGRSTIKHDKW